MPTMNTLHGSGIHSSSHSSPLPSTPTEPEDADSCCQSLGNGAFPVAMDSSGAPADLVASSSSCPHSARRDSAGWARRQAIMSTMSIGRQMDSHVRQAEETEKRLADTVEVAPIAHCKA